MGLIYDLVDLAELTGFVRGVEEERIKNKLILGQFLPNEPIDGVRWSANIGSLDDEESAELRAWDAESSIGGRQGVKRIMGEVAPSSRKYRVGEEETLRLRELETNNNDPRIRAIFDDAAKGARAVSMRFERLRAEAIWSGELNINENGVVQPVPFGRDADLQDVAVGNLWSDHTLSTPIQDEFGFLTTYKAFNNDDLPVVALASDDIINHLLLNEDNRNFFTVNGVSPAFLNLGQLNQVRANYALPPIVPYNIKARVNGSSTRLIPANRFIYMPDLDNKAGVTFTGTTAESIKLAQAKAIQQDQMAGMTAVITETDDPVATWTKTVAVGLPVLIDPNRILVAQVLA